MQTEIKLSKLRKLCMIILLMGVVLQLHSQENEKRIDELINEGNFEEAIQIGKDLLIEQPENASLNFKIGYCYMNTSLEKAKSIPFLLKSTEIFRQKKDQSAMSLEAKFYLGKAYHKNYEFKKALEVFQLMHQQVSNKEMLTAINEEIEQCKTGIELKKNPVKMEIKNLGTRINSPYSDHSPVLSADESVLIFTSRRKRFENEKPNLDGQFNEDIYLSETNGKQWTKPVGISKNINTEAHEASIGISADGQELLIYNEMDGGTIMSSKLTGTEWSTPKILGDNINTRWRETHASISADGKFLYFTSDRPGGYGGLDVYVSEKNAAGSWGKATNLGPAINTAKDEEGPFIHHDGITLYFSSKGHKGMGGLDIFSSKKNQFNTWTLAENMGYPVNTTEDDVFFVMTADGKRAFFASFREGGEGSNDIFMMSLPEAEEKPLTVVKGIVSACKNDIDDVRITVYDADNQEIKGVYKPNSASGKYLFILSRGSNYDAIYEINGMQILKENFHIAASADFQVVYKPIDLKSASPCDEYIGLIAQNDSSVNATNKQTTDNEHPETIIAENIMFKINNSEVTYFKDNLSKIANYLKENPETKLEIIGYADTQGSDAYNLILSEKRANAVSRYLIKLGVKKEQLNYHGEGEKNQLTINSYLDGSLVWQSLPYNRRVEFAVLNDKKNQLVIKQFFIPEIYRIDKSNLENKDISAYKNKFTIQIGAYSKPINISYFKNLENIQMYFSSKYYLYTTGEFNSKKLAEDKLGAIKSKGYKDAFVSKIYDYFPARLK